MPAQPPEVTVRRAEERDLEAINAIYNREIREGIATWDLDEWTLEARQAWFREHDDRSPVFVAEVDGRVAGFAYLSRYRGKPGYRWTREDTVYIAPEAQGRGIGRALLGTLVEAARALGIRAVVAWIEAENAGSIALHERFGFVLTGSEHDTGRKFGRWLSDVEMQLTLDGPADPDARD
ncbi:MAG: GNAT family N-acetyltransferase [Chloroflexi bacterium]|nr:GNAT family N-acetyltransferase [Chloroflexota bacterium]MDA1239850.1 GNAT family N-acetyltransferase [Chloroflexota bacterium]MQC47872.1 N-acetyltransferase family protein [Chloroflexota bacterium]